MKDVIDNIVASLSDHPRNTGLVVGVIRRGQRSIFGYGRANHASLAPPGGDVLFEIGSITKVFTTSLLAILTADGLLDLNAPVRDLLPSLSHFPAEITLLRLATHTAGLPKMPSNLLRSLLRNRRNPYAAYATADLFQYLSRYKPKQRRIAAEEISYSNLGVALLGHILAQASGSSYEQAVISRICDKLAMHDTRITLTPAQQKRLATPHSASGKPGWNWDLPAFAGAGTLRSTANDMLKFLAANLGAPQSPLTVALQRCHEVRSEAILPPGRLQGLLSRQFQKGQDASFRRQGIALGWFVGRLGPEGKRVHWHHGATGGYRTFTGFVKDSKTGVVVLANRGPSKLDLIASHTSTDEIGFSVLNVLQY